MIRRLLRHWVLQETHVFEEERNSRHEPSRLELLYELEQLWTYVENPDMIRSLHEAEELRRGRERRRLRMLGRDGDVVLDE